MGSPIFRNLGIDVSGLIAQHLGPALLPVTLRKVKVGARTPGALTAGTNPTVTIARGRGMVEDYKNSQIDGELVRRGDRRVLILGDTLTPRVIPEAGDEVDIEGERLRIVADGVTSDPAKATYTCQTRVR